MADGISRVRIALNAAHDRKGEPMVNRWTKLVRKAGPLLGAGILLQAGGCTLDPNALFQTIVATFLQQVVASIVAGSFTF